MDEREPDEDRPTFHIARSFGIDIGPPPPHLWPPRLVYGPPAAPGEVGIHRPIAMMDTPEAQAWIDGIREQY
jgi:hypothetical protein